MTEGGGSVIHAKGYNGQITIEGDWLTIERKGMGRIGHSKGDRRIPLASITAVQMRPAGPLANGFLKLTIPGSPDTRGGLSDAGRDENTVIFLRKQQDSFDAVRAAIESYISQRMQRTTPAAPDLADQILKLSSLRDAGILSEDEFSAKKSDLLSRM